MFGIGGFELFLILLFGFLIFGPDKLPAIAKTIGQALAKFRSAQEEMNKVIKTEVYDPNSDEPFKNPLDALEKLGDAGKSAVTGKSSTTKSSTAKPAATKPAAQKSEEKQESFSERKARYDKERAARKAAEAAEPAAAAEAAPAVEAASAAAPVAAAPAAAAPAAAVKEEGE